MWPLESPLTSLVVNFIIFRIIISSSHGSQGCFGDKINQQVEKFL